MQWPWHKKAKELEDRIRILERRRVRLEAQVSAVEVALCQVLPTLPESSRSAFINEVVTYISDMSGVKEPKNIPNEFAGFWKDATSAHLQLMLAAARGEDITTALGLAE